MDIPGTLRSATEKHQAGQLAEAEALYRSILDIAPEHPQSNHNLGILAMQIGRLRQAAPLLEKALLAVPGHAGFWHSLSQCHYLAGEWEQALDILEKAAARGIDHPPLANIRNAMTGREGGTKIFCIGRNKTGTTSMETALASLGFRLGLQARGEMLTKDWARGDFRRIIDLCKTADAFQDSPFSRDHTYQTLDASFPGSKFILTLRDSPEAWYESLIRFHTKLINKGRLPTADDLRECEYRYKGYLWESNQLKGLNEKTLYDRDLYISSYLNHNQQVIDYFSQRPNDLLVINVAETDAMRKLCAFLGIDYQGQRMPHLNRST